MITHYISIDVYDQPARVLAINFATRRLVVQWGTGIEVVDVGFGLRTRTMSDGRTFDEWYRFAFPHQWTHSPEAAARNGGQDLGECRDFDEMRIRADGPGLAPLRQWFIEQALARDQENAQRKHDPLPKVYPSLWSHAPTLRTIAAWLLQRTLRHGADLHDLAQVHRSTITDTSRIDAVVLPLISLGIVTPYSWAPRPGTFASDAVNDARDLPNRLSGHGALAPNGCIFWYFTNGPRFNELPRFSL